MAQLENHGVAGLRDRESIKEWHRDWQNIAWFYELEERVSPAWDLLDLFDQQNDLKLTLSRSNLERLRFAGERYVSCTRTFTAEVRKSIKFENLKGTDFRKQIVIYGDGEPEKQARESRRKVKSKI